MAASRAAAVAPGPVQRGLQGLAVVGVVALGYGLYAESDRAWLVLLLCAYLLVEFGIAGAFFLATHEVAGATWHATLRRIPAALVAALPFAAVVLLLVLVVRPGLYPWYTDPGEPTAALAFKQAWLTRPFFLLRSVVYLAVWVVLTRAVVRTAAARGGRGPGARWAIAFLVGLGLTLPAASFDWVMSLDPHWYSTIYGFYEFASMFLGGLAMMVLLALALPRLTSAVRPTAAQLHDFGKLLFGFATFWAYLWFSQYMLIWYTNIPEETAYFTHRLSEGWTPLFVLTPLCCWLVPFVLLLPAWAKQHRGVLAVAAGSALLGRVLDLYVAMVPALPGAHPGRPFEVLALAGAVALFGLVAIGALGRTRDDEGSMAESGGAGLAPSTR
ncbi:MAG: hypothetical protein FJW23_05745 [Acidimicrobiia bacterium]|nr:hypothetical protein [Acidimicrobiia bacterium]